LKNLIIRALTGFLFVVTLVTSIWYSAYSFLVLFTIITGLIIWELYGLVLSQDKNLARRCTSVMGGSYLFMATFLHRYGVADGDIFLPYILFILLLLIMELYYKAPNPLTNWTSQLFIQIYCAGFFSLLNFVAIDGEGTYSHLFVFAIFVCVWLNDTAAYLVGMTCGRRRLFERISPKKSWEGFFGGLIAVLLLALVGGESLTGIAWYHCLGLAAFIVAFSTWGDLTESLLKRTLAVKDSGKILPGHGGLLDRFDSALMAIPAAYIYIEMFIRN